MNDKLYTPSYSVILTEKDNKFFLYIPEVSVTGISNTISAACADMCEQREKVCSRMMAIDVESLLSLV